MITSNKAKHTASAQIELTPGELYQHRGWAFLSIEDFAAEDLYIFNPILLYLEPSLKHNKYRFLFKNKFVIYTTSSIENLKHIKTSL